MRPMGTKIRTETALTIIMGQLLGVVTVTPSTWMIVLFITAMSVVFLGLGMIGGFGTQIMPNVGADRVLKRVSNNSSKIKIPTTMTARIAKQVTGSRLFTRLRGTPLKLPY